MTLALLRMLTEAIQYTHRGNSTTHLKTGGVNEVSQKKITRIIIARIMLTD
jgi:hypothetical protein